MVGVLLGGGKRSQAQQPTAVAALQFQTSAYGKAIPIVYGTTRVAPNLIWYGDFVGIPHTSSAGAGGKGGAGGGGGGKGGGGSTSYTYQTALELALCEGPIQGVGAAYIDKAVTTPAARGFSVFTGAYPQSPWGYLATNYGGISEARAVPGSGPYTVAATYASTFQQDNGVSGPGATTTFTPINASPGLNQYLVGYGPDFGYIFNAGNAGQIVIISYLDASSVLRTLRATVPNAAPYRVATGIRLGLGLGVAQDRGVKSFANVAYAKVGSSPAAQQYSVSGGVYTFNAAQAGQSVTLNYVASQQSRPFQALGYNGIAYVAASAYDLGNNPQIPNHNFEVLGRHSNTVPGSTDADPSLVIPDLLFNAYFGAGFPGSRVGSLATYQDYTLATGLVISVALTEQTPAAQFLSDLVRNTNSEFVWSAGLLTVVPYGDQAATGNGHTYTPPASALYDLTDDDFIHQPDTDPVQLTRKRPADALNSLKLEYLDRANAYNPAVVEAKDQALIDTFGLRQDSSRQAHMLADANAARLSVQLQLQREALRNSYQFTLDERYLLLDPMDLVSITDSGLGLNRQWVRVTDIAENDDRTLTFTAEEYLGGAGSAPAYSFQPAQGYAADYNASAGDTSPPVLFEPPVQIAAANGLEVWLAASGGANWGGCDVWISGDGNTYKLAGRVNGPARQGVLTATLASHADPDTSNTLAVDLTQSRGTLLSGTQTDADTFQTLCYADGELISYRTATLTGLNQYSLASLRRGAFGTAIAAHAAGTAFARLDQGIFAYPYDKGQIGQTLFVKLPSFNVFGGGQQQLSDVAATPYTIQGPPKPPNVTGFSVQQKDAVVVFSWQQVSDFALKGYDIAYGPQGGTPWEDMTLLSESARGTEMTNAAVPPGTWTFAIRARDIADQLSPAMTTADLVITNPNFLVASQLNAPDWPDPVDPSANLPSAASYFRHWTGAVVPKSRKLASDYDFYTPAPTPIRSYVPGGALAQTTYYVLVTSVSVHGYEYIDTNPASPSTVVSFTVPANNLLRLDAVSPRLGLDPIVGANVYVGASAGALTKQNAAPLPANSSWTMPATGLVAGAALPTTNTLGWEVFDRFVPDPVAAANIHLSTLDIGYVDTARVWYEFDVALGPNQTPGTDAPNLDVLLTTPAGSFDHWVLGSLTFRYLTPLVSYIPVAGQVYYLKDFRLHIDKAPQIENGGNVAVAAGGTTIAFAPQYHNPPYVQVTPVAGTALYATADNITATQATLHVWNSSGADVGGTVNWSATGE